jgi:hypothetical protein
MSRLDDAMREIRAERDHRERRHERELVLLDSGRRDSAEDADYADGVRFGLDLALSILSKHGVVRVSAPGARREFAMSESQRKAIMAAKSENRAWQRLGAEMGFDWKTVEPMPGEDCRYFTAQPIPNIPRPGEVDE